jgi:hypothetical protein
MIKYVNVLHALRKSNHLKTQVEIALKFIQNHNWTQLDVKTPFFLRDSSLSTAVIWDTLLQRKFGEITLVCLNKDVFRYGCDTQFWPLPLKEDLTTVFNLISTQWIFAKL